MWCGAIGARPLWRLSMDMHMRGLRRSLAAQPGPPPTLGPVSLPGQRAQRGRYCVPKEPVNNKDIRAPSNLPNFVCHSRTPPFDRFVTEAGPPASSMFARPTPSLILLLPQSGPSSRCRWLLSTRSSATTATSAKRRLCARRQQQGGSSDAVGLAHMFAIGRLFTIMPSGTCGGLGRHSLIDKSELAARTRVACDSLVGCSFARDGRIAGSSTARERERIAYNAPQVPVR